MDFQFVDTNAALKGALILPVAKGKALNAFGKKLDSQLKGSLARSLANSPRFSGDKDEMLVVNGVAHKDITHIILLGTGDIKKLDEKKAHGLGAVLAKYLDKAGLKDVTLHLDDMDAEMAANIVFGARLAAYRFDKYKTTLTAEQKPSLKTLRVAVKDKKAVSALWKDIQGLAECIYFARDLVTEPPNMLYPAKFVQYVRKEIKGLPLTLKLLNKEQMTKLGMGALLAVNQASDREPYTLILEYNGKKSKKKDFPLALIGKGVTFDTGGLNIKLGGTAFPMADMKTDMAGGAAVAAGMIALAKRKAKANVVGLVGLVENVISDEAYIPSDVITSMSGQTIEVLNTDAEGRLVMADVMWYAQENYKPKYMIDIATLTGSIIMALGDQYAGLFCENDAFTKQIFTAGQESTDRVWQMPMDCAGEQNISSMIADMTNLSSGGTGAAAAALFLRRFVQKGVVWAHVDMAGVAWSRAGKTLSPAGATGFGVRLFDRLVRNHFEK